jgi:hypothetical protein
MVREKGENQMSVREKLENQMSATIDFNKLFDDMEAAWRAFFDGKMTEELKKQAREASEKVKAAIDEATKTDPEFAERLTRRAEYREKLRLKCPPERRERAQAEIEKQNCKCAQCGGPLDIDQQMMFLPPNMICDFCCEEMIVDTERYGTPVA